MRDRLEAFFLFITGLSAIVVSVLDLLGMLDQIDFLSQRIPTMTLLILGVAVGYLSLERRSRLDKIQQGLLATQNLIIETGEKILSQPLRGIEVFSSTDELTERLAEITVGAESVSTLNLSPARGTSPALDKYFTHVHRYIHKNGVPLRNFRSLASLESASKARWMVARAVELAPTGRASIRVIPSDLLPPHTVTKMLLGCHIVYKEGNPYVFFYRPVDPSGVMDCFLIKNEEVAHIMLKYFEGLWNEGVPINTGKRIDKKGLDEILKVDNNIINDTNFIALSERAKLYE